MNCNKKIAFAVLALIAMLAVPAAVPYEADADEPLQGYGEAEGITVTYEAAISEGKPIGTLLIELSDAPNCSSYIVSVDKTSTVLPRTSLLGGYEFRLGSANYLLTAGSHTVSVSADNYSVRCILIVGEIVMQLDRTAVTLLEGESVLLTCTSVPELDSVQWSSSDTDVATVTDGLITAVGIGHATVTASYLDMSSVSCSVDVCESEAGVFYFFIKYDTESAGTELLETVDLGMLTVDQLTDGYWVKTKADNAANALVAASEFMQTSLSFSDFYYGWLDTFMGLGTVSIDSSTFAYWTQYSWNSGWTFNEVCLGYIEATAHEQYIALVFCVSTMEGGVEALDQDPYDIPMDVRSSTPAEFALKSIEIEGGDRTMYLDDTSSVTCVMSPSSVPMESVSWTVGDSTIISLSYGTLMALSAGVTTVTASCGGKSDTITVTVLDGSVQSVTLNKTELEVQIGSSEQLTATVEPSYALDKSVIWSTSDSDVATVDQDGNVTGVSKGTAVITVTSVSNPDASDSCTVTVKGVPVTDVSLDRSEMKVAIGATGTLVATVLPSNATDRDVEWSSSDAEVASVDENGIVSGLKEGEVTITVTTVEGGFTATCSVTVAYGYKVQFEVFGGIPIDDMTYYTLPEDTILPIAEKEGCLFIGWYDNANLMGTIVKKIPAMSTGDKKFYASFVKIDKSYYINSVGVRGFIGDGESVIIDIDAGENAPDKVLNLTYSTMVDIAEGSFIYPFNKATMEVPAKDETVSFSPADGSHMLSVSVYCSYLLDNVLLSTKTVSEICPDVSADADIDIDADAVLKLNGTIVSSGDRLRFGIYTIEVIGTAEGYTVNGIDADGTNTINYYGQKLTVLAEP